MLPLRESECYLTLQACPDCEGGREIARRLQQQEIEKRFQRAAVPPMFAAAKLADFTGAVLELAERVCRQRASLFLHGLPGRGKSHLAAALLLLALADGRPGLFIEVPELMAQLRRSIKRGEDLEVLIGDVQNVEVLVLDDVGTEQDTPWVQENVFRVINHRYSHRLQTIATTNVPDPDLRARLGQRTVSRLVGMGEVLELTGVDRRLRGRRVTEAERA